jgi:hypothetical protein
MQTFYVTFGVRYREEPHPIWPKAHPDGYLTVIAKNEEMARRFTAALLANQWAFIYTEDNFNTARWTRGELGRIEFSEAP